MRRILACITLLSAIGGIAPVLWPSPAVASDVREIPLAELVRDSDLIALAHVTRIESIARPQDERYPIDYNQDGSFVSDWRSEESMRVAEAEIIRRVKGEDRVSKLYFLAQRTWTCDDSTAIVGESALLFLDDLEWVQHEGPKFRATLSKFTGDAPIFRIAHSGRGRMPLRRLESVDYATYWTDIVMPEEMPNIDGPQKQFAGFIRSAPLSDLESRVKTLVVEQGARVRAEAWSRENAYAVWSIAAWRNGHSELRYAGGDIDSSCLKGPEEPFWTFLAKDRFPAWPDSPVSATSEKFDFKFDLLSDGKRCTIRLPDPSTLKSPLDPGLEEALRVWLTLLDAAESPDALEIRKSYRELLTTKR